MADFGEIFGSDESNDGAVETPAGSPQSEEERSYRSESEARSDQSEAEDNAQNSDASEQHSEAEASGSDDERRNDSDAEQSDRSMEEKSNHSDAASERSRQSDASEDEGEAASVRSEGVASDNEASEREEEHSEHERSEQSGGEASGSDVEREGSEHPDQSDAEVGSEHQDQSDVEREASVEREGSDQREGSENEASDNEQGSVRQDASDAERSERQEESEVEHSGNEEDAEGAGGDHQSDRHSEYSGRSRSPRGSENEASEREAKSGSESDEEAAQNKKAKQGDESEASHREGSDSDDDDVQPKKRKKGSTSDASQKGSGSDEDFAPKKKRQAVRDDEDDDDLGLKGSDEEGAPKATTQDLFGEDLGDISSDEEKKEKPTGEEGEEEEMSKVDGEGEEAVPEMEADEEEAQQEEPVPETRIEVEIPRIVTNLGKDVHFVKLPNFLSVETRPYDPQWYEDEIDEDEVLDEEGRARMKLKVENTMRWRYAYDDDGNQKRESNARIVKWSDGSMSLHLGSEIFDVHKQTLMQGDHNHLFIRQGTGLQGQAVFRTKLTFRPHSTDSFTHRKMTLSLADRSQKTQKIRVLPTVGKDPEAHRSEMIKKEEDRLKASIRRESKQKRMREKATTRGLSTSYLEPDRYYDEDDEGAISLSAIKNKYKKGGAALRDRPSIYTDSEGSDDESRAKRLEDAKEMDDDDSDLDYFDKKKANEGKKKAMAKIEESDEDD